MESKPSFYVVCLALSSGMAVAACSQGPGGATDPAVGQSLDPLLSAAGADGGGACVSCIQASCATELNALEVDLKGLRTEATSAFQCVRDSACFSSMTQRDAGGRAAASACIAACVSDAGLPAPGAAASTVQGLAAALDQCIDTSCASTCPGAANDRDDRDGGSPRSFPTFDASFPSFDGSCAFDGNFPRFDAGGFGEVPPFDAGFPGFGRGFPAFDAAWR